ncbi:MAG: ThiF family adenylyltransferase [Fuerstiella sp.]|nr:ThiF family adenylyltransferase [Fuerstiella sp.]
MEDLARYQKQMLFSGIQQTGQKQLRKSHVLQVGCGALGCVVADHLVRAGIGQLRIVDRDFVELSNLQRQILFTEQDVTEHLPKAIVAERRLKQVNSNVQIESYVADVDYQNIQSFANAVDLIIDGTDNFEIRYLINDVSLEFEIPWIYTGCTGSTGQVMPVFPGRSGCLRCLIPDAPPPGSTETCDTAGVLGPAIGMVASLQSAIALRILSGNAEDVPLQLSIVDVWDGSMRAMDVSALRDQGNCPACDRGERPFLSGSTASGSTVLCGRNAVQVSPASKLSISLEELSHRLESAGVVTSNSFLARVVLEESGMEITVFPDGRAIIRGTEDPAAARAVYSRYIGV